LPAFLNRRVLYSSTSLVLGALVALSVALLLRRGHSAAEGQGGGGEITHFVVILAGIGSLLILTPEFIYLKDLFGTRMNTVFKFYYAAWILWALAAAYATTELWPARLDWRGGLRLLALIPLGMGLVYPALATWTKTAHFNPPDGRTLDGIAHMSRGDQEDYRAILWINENLSEGVIAEAVGGSYTGYARISAHTGLPTVLGWEFHEIQWRGTAQAQGSRKQDVQTLYETRTWDEAEAILDRYDIRYV
jgi:uncharacterized membrane protein